jgi:hypothetical protein
MNTEAHKHLRMGQLLRRKALHLADPSAMRRKANSFLALAKMAAMSAKRQTVAPPPNVSRPAPPSLPPPRAPFRTTRLDPRNLFGPMRS